MCGSRGPRLRGRERCEKASEGVGLVQEHLNYEWATTMPIFDDLRSEYKTGREATIHYYRRCEIFARTLSTKLQQYVGAPKDFTDFKGRTSSYIDTVGVEQLNDGTYQSVENAGYGKLIQPDENGYWLTGLKVVLDVAPNTWPKEGFLFLVRFVIREDECEMYIAESKQATRFKLDDPNGPNAAFDLIVEMLKNAFARKPWDQTKKTSIGFVNLGETQK
jgi:hypothetical protein